MCQVLSFVSRMTVLFGETVKHVLNYSVGTSSPGVAP